MGINKANLVMISVIHLPNKKLCLSLGTGLNCAKWATNYFYFPIKWIKIIHEMKNNAILVSIVSLYLSISFIYLESH